MLLLEISGKMRIKSLFKFILILQLFTLIHVSCADALHVCITGDRISIHADEVPLQNILKRMVDLGIRVRIDPTLNPKITASFENRDIQKGIGSILKPLNYAMIWETMKNVPVPVAKLTEIQVFKPGKQKCMESLASPGFVVKKNPSDGSLYIKDEIMLMLKPGVSYADFMKLLEKIGGTVVDVDRILGIYRIRLPENSDVPSLVNRIINCPGISEAEPNYAYPILLPYRGKNSVDMDKRQPFNLHRKGHAPIAILDSGLRPDAGTGDIVLASFDALNPDEMISDDLGHGTQMALIAGGLVQPYGSDEIPGAQGPIIPIRIFDDKGVTSNFTIMRSVDFALENGARVMSLSWGAETRSKFLKSAFEYAGSKGLFIVAAAGNEPTGKPVYPAAYPSVIGVGALSPDGRPWAESNYGDFVTVSAPGFAAFPVGYKGEPGIYAGTSISTAFVAGVISDYVSLHPEATLKEVCSVLHNRF